ncbi:hypothetical protein HJC99_06455 [Candidatus Saccharibacteria bacterium]|nr:hypothetical protein [Candidatus Saccharibacteria bacterium]
MPDQLPAVSDVVAELVAFLADLHVLAVEAAVPTGGRDNAALQPFWEPRFNVHGDPSIVEQGRGTFGLVATVSTSPRDYGRARARFIGTIDPALMMALLPVLIQLVTERPEVGALFSEALTRYRKGQTSGLGPPSRE